MKKLILFSVLAICIMALSTATVFGQFSISGEFKARGEYRDGYLSLRDSSKSPMSDLLGRARLLFDYKSDKLTTRFSLYDAWVFGQDYYSSDTLTKNTVNVYEAWVKYNFNPAFGIKVGRIELSYDDERLLGASNWSMWGATHDVVVAQYASPLGTVKGDVGFAINNTAPAQAYLSSYTLGKNYKYMGYLYFNRKFLKNRLTLSVLGIEDAFQKTLPPVTKTDTLFIRNQNDSIIGTTLIKTTKSEEFIHTIYGRVTVGASLLYQDKTWGFYLNGYLQWGHYRDGRELSSNFYTAWASFQPAKFIKLQAGYEHLSGNNFSDTTGIKKQVTGFSTLYGTSHRWYGYMDMFNSLAKDNLSPGLNDLFGRITLSLDDKNSFEVTYRWFSLPYGYLSKPTKTKPYAYLSVEKSLGSEIDLVYSLKPLPNLEFNAAYCFFLQTSTMEIYNKLTAGTGEFAQYAYLMITYKPNFFTSDKH